VGKAKRIVPSKLPEKLKQIRLDLDQSLEKMVTTLEAELLTLGYSDVKLYSGYITEFEQGKREPILPVLLAYGRISKINVENLIDNMLEIHP
jgi:hypothetical protein